jgi:hypothetical protein
LAHEAGTEAAAQVPDCRRDHREAGFVTLPSAEIGQSSIGVGLPSPAKLQELKQLSDE